MSVKKQKYDDGTIAYWKGDDTIHREGGPAITKPNGEKYWLLNGEMHRIDGPAVILSNSKQYWLFGIKYSYKEWSRRRKMLWLL